jgi:UDP-N-acetylglucosamine 2-epimerase (hydrolysing)
MYKSPGGIFLIRKVLFITGTRADFGKMKPLMRSVANDPDFECQIFATGMHTLSKYGMTVDEIYKAGFTKIHVFLNQLECDPMDIILSNTISGLSRFTNEYKPDMIVVHGDRIEALAGSIVGALNNILVAHIEGGELSGTIDGVIRHAVSKLSHLHFVSSTEAAERLKQLGEDPETVNVIGSPDIDIMISKDLPDIDTVKRYYEIPFKEYGIATFHPVTTEQDEIYENSMQFVSALIESGKNYVVIYPNNDQGCTDIFRAYKKFNGNKRFRVFPSLRFEYFLTMLKHAEFVIGNSSVGIREAPIYGVYSINVGSRQNDRAQYHSIINTGYKKDEILATIASLPSLPECSPSYMFGKGDSAELFMNAIKGETLWETKKQKSFVDLPRR